MGIDTVDPDVFPIGAYQWSGAVVAVCRRGLSTDFADGAHELC